MLSEPHVTLGQVCHCIVFSLSLSDLSSVWRVCFDEVSDCVALSLITPRACVFQVVSKKGHNTSTHAIAYKNGRGSTLVAEHLRKVADLPSPTSIGGLCDVGQDFFERETLSWTREGKSWKPRDASLLWFRSGLLWDKVKSMKTTGTPNATAVGHAANKYKVSVDGRETCLAMHARELNEDLVCHCEARQCCHADNLVALFQKTHPSASTATGSIESHVRRSEPVVQGARGEIGHRGIRAGKGGRQSTGRMERCRPSHEDRVRCTLKENTAMGRGAHRLQRKSRVWNMEESPQHLCSQGRTHATVNL